MAARPRGWFRVLFFCDLELRPPPHGSHHIWNDLSLLLFASASSCLDVSGFHARTPCVGGFEMTSRTRDTRRAPAVRQPRSRCSSLLNEISVRGVSQGREHAVWGGPRGAKIWCPHVPRVGREINHFCPALVSKVTCTHNTSFSVPFFFT